MCQINFISNGTSLSLWLLSELQKEFECDILKSSDLGYISGSLNSPPPDILITDIPSLYSNEMFFRNLKNVNPEISVIVLASRRKPRDVEYLGHFSSDDIIVLPDKMQQEHKLKLRDSLLKKISTYDRLIHLQKRLREEMRQSLIIGKSKPMLRVMFQLPELANSTATVLITGETGTGKELIARAIHYLGPRADHPFIPVDCGALPDQLIENELFGHFRGAYTDANCSRNGLIRDADGGTLFLDEVESLPISVQSKFLRFLQERQIKPLGQSKYISMNVRIIAATNTKLNKAVEEKTFRGDLYFRLNVIPLFLPPLRKRKTEIPILVSHFLQKYGHNSLNSTSLPEEKLRSWIDYHWPGNIRELENKVQEWMTVGAVREPLDDSSILPAMKSPIRTLKQYREEVLAESEKAYFCDLLSYTAGNISAAARHAGIDRKNLRVLLRKHGIDTQTFRQ